MTTLRLVRHGRASAGWDRDPDPGLDSLGWEQARAVAARLAGFGPLPVLVSPLPHSVPGSRPTCPIESTTVVPLRSTIASSPLNSEPPYVWSAWARIAMK